LAHFSVECNQEFLPAADGLGDFRIDLPIHRMLAVKWDGWRTKYIGVELITIDDPVRGGIVLEGAAPCTRRQRLIRREWFMYA
jgi:hypothetical protein